MSVQPAPLSRRARKKAETRRRIFDSAMALFSERDFDDVTIEEICELADVANATFFLHFPTKASLIEEFHRRLNKSVADAVTNSAGNAYDRMLLVRKVLASHQVPGSVQKTSVKAGETDIGAGDDGGLDAVPQLVSIVAGIVREGQDSGDFRTEFEPWLVATSLISSWYATQSMPPGRADQTSSSDPRDQVLDLILQGIAK